MSSAEKIAELEEKLTAEVAAGQDRAQGYRDDLEAAASRVDSLAGQTCSLAASSSLSTRQLMCC